MNKHARSKPAILTTQKQSNRQRIKRWLLTSTLIIFSGAGLSLAGWLFSNGIPGASATAQEGPISSQAMEQIVALMKEKETRTGAQQKIGSQLIYALKMRRGASIAEGVQRLETGLPDTDQGIVRLDLKVTEVNDALLNQLIANGAHILEALPEYNSVKIELSIETIGFVAAMPEVLFVEQEPRAMTSRVVKTAQDGPQPAVSHDRAP